MATKQLTDLLPLRTALGMVLCMLSLHAMGQEEKELALAETEELAAALSVDRLPVTEWTPKLQELGAGGAIRLRGTQSEASVGFGIRRDEQVESARSQLQFTLSPSLLADLSHLKVSSKHFTLNP